MKAAEFDNSIRNGFQALVDVGLSGWDRQLRLRSLDPPKMYKHIAMATDNDYQEVFKAGLRWAAYNFLLEDYSYFQFWHDSRKQPRKLRYAYYPNPFDVIPTEPPLVEIAGLIAGSEMQELDYQAMDEASIKIGRPPIRYDLAFDDRIECEHPASHLTVGHHSSNRWPVSIVLTPKLFVLFVCKHYYGEKWSSVRSSRATADGFFHRLDQAMANEKTNCLQLNQEHFSIKERRHLFIG